MTPHLLEHDKSFHPSLAKKRKNLPVWLKRFWSWMGGKRFLREFREWEGKGYSQVEWGRTPFWKDATWRPVLQPTGSNTLRWPNPLTNFQNFCGTIAQCFKISFQSTKNQKWKKKKKEEFSVSLIAPRLICSRRPRAASEMALNKQASLGLWEMKNGTFRTSVKCLWVGAAECVC